MLFDKLCSAIEGNPKIDHLLGGGVREILRECAVFEFEDPFDHGAPPPFLQDVDFDKADHFVMNDFKTPFDSTCVEDCDGLVIFFKSKFEGFISCFVVKQDSNGNLVIQSFLDWKYPIQSFLDWKYPQDGRGIIFNSDIKENTTMIAAKKDGTILIVHHPRSGDNPESKLLDLVMQDTFAKDVRVGTDEIYKIMHLSAFIIERAPTNLTFQPRLKKGQKPPIPRTDRRPLFTVLTNHQVRERLHLGGTHGSPMPHWRRRHIRTLRDERFGENRGKQIIIPATWIGPTEAVVDGKRYVVRIDL